MPSGMTGQGKTGGKSGGMGGSGYIQVTMIGGGGGGSGRLKDCPADFVTDLKKGWDLENPTEGAYYRIDMHEGQDRVDRGYPSYSKGEYREFGLGAVGDYVQLISLYNEFDVDGEVRPCARVRNLNTGRSGSFERHSMFAGALTKVDEMEAVLYAKERKT